MALQTQTRRPTRTASPERWQRAAQRAVAEGIQIRQVNASGQWVATSGTDATMAYIVGVTRGVAHDCTCQAGQFGDPICKHRAAYFILTGMLDPEPPAALAA